MNYNSEEKNMLKAAVLSTMILSVFFFMYLLTAVCNLLTANNCFVVFA